MGQRLSDSVGEYVDDSVHKCAGSIVDEHVGNHMVDKKAPIWISTKYIPSVLDRSLEALRDFKV
jgi:hypothetical protein